MFDEPSLPHAFNNASPIAGKCNQCNAQTHSSQPKHHISTRLQECVNSGCADFGMVDEPLQQCAWLITLAHSFSTKLGGPWFVLPDLPEKRSVSLRLSRKLFNAFMSGERC